MPASPPSMTNWPRRAWRPLGAVLAALMLVGIVAAVPGRAPAAAATDPVVTWNTHATESLLERGGNRPQEASPHFAMVHGAVFDAVNAIRGGHRGYLLRPATAPASASVDAAVASAAHGVLVHLRPEDAAILDSHLSDALTSVPAGPDREAGIATGERAAAAMVAARADDGRYGPGQFTPSAEIGEWRPELPDYLSDPHAWLKDVEPFMVRSARQFRTPPPPALGSRRYARDYREVLALGGIDSTERTADQEQAARYWAMNPPAIWNRVLRQVAVDHDLAVEDNAVLFAKAWMSAADAQITVWDSKDHWSFWRPITAIAQAGCDGNRRTHPASGWRPLLNTPPYPEHPSGHLGLSGAMIFTLRRELGTDAVTWTDSNDAGTRSFDSLEDTLDEIIGARIWSGIHFRSADVDAARIGRRVTRWASHHAFSPRPASSVSGEG